MPVSLPRRTTAMQGLATAFFSEKDSGMAGKLVEVMTEAHQEVRIEILHLFFELHIAASLLPALVDMLFVSTHLHAYLCVLCCCCACQYAQQQSMAVLLAPVPAAAMRRGCARLSHMPRFLCAGA